MSRDFRGAATAFVTSEPVAAEPPREFAFSDADFRSLAQFAHEQAGIALADSKRNRLQPLVTPPAGAWPDLVSPISRTSRRRSRRIGKFHQRDFDQPHQVFFREAHHFDHFARMSPCLSCKARTAPLVAALGLVGRLFDREEPYTIAVVLKHEIRDLDRHDVRILATDIDTVYVIGKGVRGEYQA